ncbi:hypothetical protein [Lysinibacillus sp. NPDC056185]|uniref:hypothetical protein n=1 Tax=Lysinibacillus sp. NPDC056185 TaxID=3345739 RepID=UPI0039EFB7AA
MRNQRQVGLNAKKLIYNFYIKKTPNNRSLFFIIYLNWYVFMLIRSLLSVDRTLFSAAKAVRFAAKTAYSAAKAVRFAAKTAYSAAKAVHFAAKITFSAAKAEHP